MFGTPEVEGKLVCQTRFRVALLLLLHTRSTGELGCEKGRGWASPPAAEPRVGRCPCGPVPCGPVETAVVKNGPSASRADRSRSRKIIFGSRTVKACILFQCGVRGKFLASIECSVTGHRHSEASRTL